MVGPFTALRFTEILMMNTVCVEIQDSALYVEKPADIDRYATNFERLTQLALDGEETLAFLE
jgi:hypothetical protein